MRGGNEERRTGNGELGTVGRTTPPQFPVLRSPFSVLHCILCHLPARHIFVTHRKRLPLLPGRATDVLAAARVCRGGGFGRGRKARRPKTGVRHRSGISRQGPFA